MLLQNLAISMLALQRWAKRFVVTTVDAGLCILSVWLAYYLWLGELWRFQATLNGPRVLPLESHCQPLLHQGCIAPFFVTAAGLPSWPLQGQ